MIDYKGYTGIVEFDSDLGLFAGHVIDLRDEIYFEGESVEELVESMKRAVDHYLEISAKRGEAPERPVSPWATHEDQAREDRDCARCANSAPDARGGRPGGRRGAPGGRRRHPDPERPLASSGMGGSGGAPSCAAGTRAPGRAP